MSFDLEVLEAIGQRCRHAVGYAAVSLAVAGSKNRPALGYAVFPQAPIQDQLVGGG